MGGALRAAQDFDLRNIGETAELRRRAAVDRTILQEGDRAIGSEIDAGQPIPRIKSVDERSLPRHWAAAARSPASSMPPAPTSSAPRTEIAAAVSSSDGRLGRGDDDHVFAGAGRRSSATPPDPAPTRARRRQRTKSQWQQEAPRKADLCHVLLHTDGIYNLPISILVYGRSFWTSHSCRETYSAPAGRMAASTSWSITSAADFLRRIPGGSS